uniref:Uncharacterized protein n=1 Tax=Anguilla anguilla TaxID=7936 RepID=A0A0E9QLV8_ANGAN
MDLLVFCVFVNPCQGSSFLYNYIVPEQVSWSTLLLSSAI